MSENKIKIMLIEDYEPDINLFCEIVEEHGKDNWEIINTSGNEALEYLLNNKARNQNASEPMVIVLDLNLPTINGKEILKRIKQCKETCAIPVIILSSSSNKEEIKLCYELGASCYLTKSLDVNENLWKLKLLLEFWSKVVQLPM